MPSATPPFGGDAVALAEVLPVGVLLAGDDGSVRYANRRWPRSSRRRSRLFWAIY